MSYNAVTKAADCTVKLTAQWPAVLFRQVDAGKGLSADAAAAI
jgi:hypothetical protein